MSGKGMREVGKGGMKGGEKKKEKRLLDNGAAAFISLSISMWERGTEQEGGEEGEMDLGREREGIS